MTHTVFSGFVVERWSEENIEASKRALAERIAGGWSSSPPNAFALKVHATKGAAWLMIEDSARADKYEPRDNLGLAAALARATGSAVWFYDYLDAGSFALNAVRVRPDGEKGKTHVFTASSAPASLNRKKGFDVMLWAQDQVAKLITKEVDWPGSLFRVDSPEGLKVISEVASERHELSSYVEIARGQKTLVQPVVPKPVTQAAGPIPAKLLQACEKLSSSLAEIEELLVRPNLDAYLDLTDSHELTERFNATTSAIDRFTKGSPPAKPSDDPLVRALEKRDGKPKNLSELRQIVSKARAFTSAVSFDGLAPAQAGAQLMAARELISLTYLALLSGDEVI